MEIETEMKTAELIEALSDSKTKAEVDFVKSQDPIQELGRDLIGFFKDRLQLIAKNEDFKNIVKTKLIDKINTDDKVTFSELKSLFAMLYEQGTLASESVISLLRPAGPNANNPILSSVINRDGPTKEIKGDYDTETLKKMDAIFRLVEALADKK